MAATGDSVGTAFALNIAACLIIFLLFSWLRVRSWCRRFYAPKRFDSTIVHKPRRLPPGLLGWMQVVYSYPEVEVMRVAGLDSVMYLRVMQFGWEIFLKVGLVVLVIILPVNLSGDQIDDVLVQQSQSPPPPSPPPPLGCPTEEASDVKAKSYAFSSFDKCSLANISNGSPLLWAHLVCIYVVTYIVLTTLWRFNHEATLLRLAFLANAPRGGPSHTVLVTDIPGMRHGTIIWYLRGLVGSTLFVMLPKSVRQKVLDSMESGFSAVTSNLDIANKIGQGHGKFDKQSSYEAGALVPDAFVKTAKENTQAANELEAQKQKKKSGSLAARERKSAEVVSTDEGLDPWKQAGDVLGDMNQPRSDKVKEFIHNEVEFTYGEGCVAAVNPVWDQSEINPLLAEYNAIKQKLEDHLDDLASKLKRRKPLPKKPLKVTVIPLLLGPWGTNKYGQKPTKVDALTFWMERLAYLSSVIPTVQAKCLTKAIPAAFVTTQTRKTQMSMTTALHHHDESTWNMQGAPEPKEIIWGSLPMRQWERTARSSLLWAAYIALIFFFMIPVILIQALIEVPKLAEVPVLGTIVNLPFIRQVLEAIVPGLVLVIFLAMLPALLAFMCRLSGYVSISQVVALFIGSIIAGSLLSQLKAFISNPSSIITILGVAIPVTSTFFINYLLVAGITRTGILHLRIPAFVIFMLLSKVAATPRARARLWADQYTLYGPTVAYHTIAFLLGAVYCCINPIIAPVCLIYFSVALISERYNNLYVFKREYESGGRLWYRVFNQFVVCVYFMQVIMIILLSIKKFKLTFLLIPAPVITFCFHITCLSAFKRPWSVMSAHDASQLDINDAKERAGEPLSIDELMLIQDMYLSPAFKVRAEDTDDLLREAAIIQRRVNGEKLEDIEAELEDNGYVSANDDDDVTPPPETAGPTDSTATPVDADQVTAKLPVSSPPPGEGRSAGSVVLPGPLAGVRAPASMIGSPPAANGHASVVVSPSSRDTARSPSVVAVSPPAATAAAPSTISVRSPSATNGRSPSTTNGRSPSMVASPPPAATAAAPSGFMGASRGSTLSPSGASTPLGPSGASTTSPPPPAKKA